MGRASIVGRMRRLRTVGGIVGHRVANQVEVRLVARLALQCVLHGLGRVSGMGRNRVLPRSAAVLVRWLVEALMRKRVESWIRNDLW